MPLDLSDIQFHGPALPGPFVKFELENELTKLKLLSKTTGIEAKELKKTWDVYRRHLAQLAVRGGPLRVRNQVIEPILAPLGYAEEIQQAQQVETREGHESGGYLLTSKDGESRLRVWVTALDEDLDAPAKRGQAYRFSHLRIAQRVLLVSGERVGLLTNGVELRLLISDPARPDSQILMSLDPGWKRSRDVPDSFRLLLALASPAGVKAVPDLVDKARLQQARVTKDLRDQARQAIGRFIQEVLDHPANRHWLVEQTDRDALARVLWHEGLVLVYRLLFVLKLESSDDPARSFTFASTSLWRNTFSPSMSLAPFAQAILHEGAETGGLLEGGMRRLFKMFDEGLVCTELNVKPLGGTLFGTMATPVLSRLCWGERAVAHLLDQLLWTTPKKKGSSRERVHYGPLDVEDLGRVYEALLELAPGISNQPMCRLRRQKLEVVLPVAQGEKYRPKREEEIRRRGEREKGNGGDEDHEFLSSSPPLPFSSSPVDGPEDEDEVADEDTSDRPSKGTTVQWIEEIPADRFYLRVGLGRKASGSYYTPHSFVRFLVQETLGPQVAERSPQDDSQPGEILKLRVLDPAMGSGHFLVEACRFLGQHLYEAARLCDEKAIALEFQAEKAGNKAEREKLETQARAYRQRVLDLPDPDDELVRYLPSRSVEGEQSGVSQRKAEALCRRMVAVHCLYGVDKNPLAVELAKLALWLESHAEGMPLTFLDHRLVVGDSLTGPFWERLLTWPSKPDEKLEGVIFRGLENRLRSALFDALRHVKRLEASVGVTLAEVAEKQAAKADLDDALLPFRVAAAAWAGGVMLGPEKCDDVAYAELLQTIATTHELPNRLTSDTSRLAAETPSEYVRGEKKRRGDTETRRRGDSDLSASPRLPIPVSSPVASRLRAMIARGLGIDDVPDDGAALAALVKSGCCVPALPYDLTFPEVFYPNGVPYGRHGFDAVLGNPPWEAIQFKSKEFFAAFDFEILNAPTKRERLALEGRLMADPRCGPLFDRYKEEFEEQKRVNDTLYEHQKVFVHGDLAGRQLDAFRVFAERNAQLLTSHGILGALVPSGFHANEGATGIRQLYLEKMALFCCYSFENRRKLFEIDSRAKFALVVVRAGRTADTFLAAFYVHDDEWLFTEARQRDSLRYTLDFVRNTGGEYLTFLELRSSRDADVARRCFEAVGRFGSTSERAGLRFGTECHMTNDSWRFTPTDEVCSQDADPRNPIVCADLIQRRLLLLHDDKTYDTYSDLTRKWRPRYLVPLDNLGDKPSWVRSASFYRLSFRNITGATNYRTCIAHLLPPGHLFGHGASCDRTPENHATFVALGFLSVLASFAFDYCLRLKTLANLSLFIVDGCPFPAIETRRPFLAHSALRLTCNHSGYAPLWHEQLGDAWREPGKPQFTWPVLAGDDERWDVRSAIDAVVADAYGLSRDQYAHVLSTFSHASYRKAPELCLAKFDELKQIGLDAFTRKYDPYHDIPLNENLPQPVIDLPIPGEATDDGPRTTDESDGEFRLSGTPKAKRGRKQR
ncbi:MAG: N-6 DNA methylase [Planctomycetota bacterium]|nr:N-6 DNA methylase [Planctomycetota bacterium]